MNSFGRNLLVNMLKLWLTSFVLVMANMRSVNVPPSGTETKTRKKDPYHPFCIHSQFRSSNIAEQLVEKGLASVVRHRRDDEDRSSDYDKLMAAEQV